MDIESIYKKIYSSNSSTEDSPLCKAASEGDLIKVKAYLPIALKYINAQKLLSGMPPGVIQTYETDDAFELAAKNDHIHIMKHLLRFKCVHDFVFVVDDAIKNNKLNIIDFILKNTNYDPSDIKNSDLKLAIKNKQYDIANRLYLDDRVRKQPIPKYVLKHIKPEYLEKFKPVVDNSLPSL
jgi:ankyrin repeat protein